ncbi:hypothetical protein FPZ24_04995 [Sphingomonas panacisoli]|uniref:Uncharacterized protein n=1 Tax=Sphingomonas panacisoli TaxID=1813879 RepID=A0A5B8LFD7_9SPHN|nr:hypothetical protein [Sphingomonas panacisoli]QDZ06917.1 hypothetical protein FPZ24_04995 [Sphingomonas panacisoli]
MGKDGDRERLIKERRFFLFIAVAMFAVIVVGFASQPLTGRVWFTDFPWQVHVHVTVFSSWIILYVVQNWLVVRGQAAGLHRQLGWAGTAIAVIMVPLGIAGTIAAIARGAITGVFPLGLFLALDVLHMLGFGVLTFAAIWLRGRPAWHKRLMLCGTALLTAPALSRLLGFFHLGAFTPVAVIAGLLAFVVAGIVFDRTVWHRVHPSYWWGLGVILLIELSIVPLGGSAPIVAFARKLAG